MTEQEFGNSVQMKFKNHISYNIIKNLNANFWKDVRESCSHHKISKMHTIYPIIRRFIMKNDQCKYKQLVR